MAHLQFEQSKLDSRLASGGNGEAFQDFIFELLDSELPHLHPYPAGGKDGGIDHLTDAPGQPRTVVECKYCGTDGFEEVRQRWKATERNLAKNLEPALKPAQSQYAPWYRTDEPITHYIFTTSARLENSARCDELRDIIRDFFHALAANHSHLAHLSRLLVEVRDWTYIEPRVPAILRFRWFVRERPNGMRLLSSEDEETKGFRAWLRSSKLPFYSRARHMVVEPMSSGGELSDEKALLELLSNDADTLGLIFVGRGGVGKTRLALEIGRKAEGDGWSVWVVHKWLKAEALEQLVAYMEKDSRVLLVFDYVEIHPEFGNIVQQLASIADDTGHHIRYVATCRGSYYNAIKGAERQRAIWLSKGQPVTEEWLASYRRATVKHILAHANISLDERSIAACHDLPILAAFLHWLHYGGRTEELQSLLGEESFGKWIINRVRLSFPDRNLDHLLARLVALFPIPMIGRAALTEDETALFYRLETDGWIEKADDPIAGESTWHTAHDVMADQVALHWLSDNSSSIYEWCSDLLRVAIRFHALPSALRSLQRLAEHIAISESQWEDLLIDEARREPEEWRKTRSILLRTSLLSPIARVRLLIRVPDVYTGAEVEEEFQSALGEVLRKLVELKTLVDLDDSERDQLFDWVRRTMPHERNLQYLRGLAVQLAPEEFRLDTLSYIESRAENCTTQYVICAWLDSGLQTEKIVDSVQVWCFSNSTKSWFSYVARSWLRSGGNPKMIEPFLPKWFAEFGQSPRASFVLSSWIKYANDLQIIEKWVLNWLTENEASNESQFVLSAWLKYANAPNVVEKSVFDWLRKNEEFVDAQFLISDWLEYANKPTLIQEVVVGWLNMHGERHIAQFVIAAWLKYGASPALIQESVARWMILWSESFEAQFVISSWLISAGSPSHVKNGMLKWLNKFQSTLEARFVICAWLDHSADEILIEDNVKSWLFHHGDSLQAQFIYTSLLNHTSCTLELEKSISSWMSLHGRSVEAYHVLSRWIEVGKMHESIDGFIIGWLEHCQGSANEAVHILLPWLRQSADSNAVKYFAMNWLDQHSSMMSANFILAAWIKRSFPLGQIREHLKYWLKIHGDSPEASHIFGPWLDGGGGFSDVKDAVSLWIKEYGLKLDSVYVLVACIRIDEARHLLGRVLVDWLELHCESHVASFVFVAGLESGRNPQQIEKFMLRWLEKNPACWEASLVISAWIDNGGELSVVRGPVIRWLELRNPRDNASWVLVRWLRNGGDMSSVDRHVIDFTKTYDNLKAVDAVRRAWRTASRIGFKKRREM